MHGPESGMHGPESGMNGHGRPDPHSVKHGGKTHSGKHGGKIAIVENKTSSGK